MRVPTVNTCTAHQCCYLHVESLLLYSYCDILTALCCCICFVANSGEMVRDLLHWARAVSASIEQVKGEGKVAAGGAKSGKLAGEQVHFTAFMETSSSSAYGCVRVWLRVMDCHAIVLSLFDDEVLLLVFLCCQAEWR